MSSWMQKSARLLAILLLANAAACGFNEVIEQDEDVKAAWAEVENQYKRRADLVPNLVNTVKGEAKFETDTLQKVVEARSKVAGIKVDSSVIDNPEKIKAFEAAQNQLSGALSRLMVVSENYPSLRANEGFKDLRAQLEGTENRIAVARKRYIGAVASYNKVVLSFPSMIGAKIRGKETRPTFEGAPENANTPAVQF